MFLKEIMPEYYEDMDDQLDLKLQYYLEQDCKDIKYTYEIEDLEKEAIDKLSKLNKSFTDGLFEEEIL